MDDDDQDYCPTCDGDGEVENGDPHYTEIVTCPACNGSGWDRCPVDNSPHSTCLRGTDMVTGLH